MLIGFLDDTELTVDPEDPTPDIFAFGGYFIQLERLDEFQKRIGEVKEKYSLLSHSPIKWNLKDSGLVQFYDPRRWLNPESHKHLLQVSFDIRRDLLALLAEFDARVFLSARYDAHWRETSHMEYYGWAFENLFQRVGLFCKRMETQNCRQSSVMIVADWPQGGVDKSLFEIYMGGYHYGRGLATNQRYFSGPVSQYRFLESLTHGSTLHSGPLQIADLVVGCSRSFLSWSYLGKEPQKIRGLFDLLIGRFDADDNGSVNDYGFKVAKDYRIDVDAKILEYQEWVRQRELEEEIPF
jgi:hypothetical protein